MLDWVRMKYIYIYKRENILSGAGVKNRYVDILLNPSPNSQKLMPFTSDKTENRKTP